MNLSFNDKYSHVCGLPPKEDIINLHIPGNSKCIKFKRCLQKFIMINENHPSVKNYCYCIKDLEVEKKKHLKINNFIIHPLSNFRLMWTVITLVTSLVMLLYFPKYISSTYVPNGSTNDFDFILKLICDVICWADILINFKYAFYLKDRKICLVSKLAARRYLFSYFIFDFLSSFPTLYNIKHYKETDPVLVDLMLIIDALKFFRIFSCVRGLNFLIQFFSFGHYFGIFIILVTVIFFLLQWITCFIIVISLLTTGILKYDAPVTTESWLTNSNLWNDTYHRIYEVSLYRTALLIANSEFSDKYKTNLETVTYTIILYLSKLLYTFIVSSFILISQADSSSNSKYKELILQVQQYMDHKQLSQYTQNRLKKYFEFRFQKRFFKEIEIISKISSQLQKDILMVKCKKLLENITFFKGIPQTLLVHIMHKLEMDIYLENDVIIKHSTTGNSMYFIASGTVAIYTISGKEIYHLEDGAHFGEMALVMTNKLTIISAIALEPCELYRLDRKNFEQVVQIYPELLKNIEQITAERYQHTIGCDEKYKQYLIQLRQNKYSDHI